jgi:hypothetical protein
MSAERADTNLKKGSSSWPPEGPRVCDSYEFALYVVEREGEWHEAAAGEGDAITGTFMLISHLPRQYGHGVHVRPDQRIAAGQNGR